MLTTAAPVCSRTEEVVVAKVSIAPSKLVWTEKIIVVKVTIARSTLPEAILVL